MKKIINSTYTKVVIIGGIILFFGILFIDNLVKLGVFSEDSQKHIVLNNKIVFEQPKLSLFDQTVYLNQFPDTIHVHYPYFITVIPEDSKNIATVYSMRTKNKVTSFNDIVLDYANGHFLYNYHGGNTYYNGKDLMVHCNQGFIKSESEILCVTQNVVNPLYSNLISINPKTLSKKILYSPQNAITAVYYDTNTLYVGEYNYKTHKVYLTVNGIRSKISTFVSIFYPKKNKMYFGTFKNDQANLQASYAQIIQNAAKPSSSVVAKGKVVFY